MRKQKEKKGTPYVGGQILGQIPRNLLNSKSLSIDIDGETVISYSGTASKFLEKNGFHKKN